MNNRVLVWGFSNNRAGTESVVSNYVRCLSDELTFDIVSYEATPNYSDLFDGANELIIAPSRSCSPLAFRSFLRDLLEGADRRYSALWCNLNSYSNIDILRKSYRAGIAKRIVHAHNSQPVGSFLQKMLHLAHRESAIRYATQLCACSKVAGDFFFGKAGYEVFPNAIDYSRYSYSVRAGLQVREAYGVKHRGIVVGTVGRLNIQKNHRWIISVISKMKASGIDVACLIAGKGELESSLKSEIRSLGLENDVLLVGEIEDVSAFLSSLDVFVLPSLFEGLPLALLEAQANGLPCLVSDAVSTESSISESCDFLSIGNKDDWIDGILKARRSPFNPDTEEAKRLSLNVQVERMREMFIS